MKVLQTLGRHRQTQEGIFQYRRSSAGVLIDGSVGRAQLHPPNIFITSDEWNKILRRIEQSRQNSFRLSGSDMVAPPAPHQVLYETITAAVRSPTGGWTWNNSWLSYVSAILEHEGSVDLYAGPVGTQTAIISLAKDIP